MPPIASDAFVLRTYDFGETSRVVVLLTRDRGKVRAVAKGARGPKTRYQSALEPMSEVRVSLYGRQGAELFRIGQCELIRSAFPAGDAGLDANLLLSYFAELIDGFAAEGEAEDAVYRLASVVLRASEGGMSTTVLSRYLEAWLLKLHGIYPSTKRCARCNGALPSGSLRYHAPARGFLCETCGGVNGPLLSPGIRGFLDEAFQHAPADMSGALPADVAALEHFHQDLIVQHLERPLRSYRVLKDVARSVQG
jgi:DNA repair protein RecO (recombination protein O)